MRITDAGGVREVDLVAGNTAVSFHWHWTETNAGPGGTGNTVDLHGHEKWLLVYQPQLRPSFCSLR